MIIDAHAYIGESLFGHNQTVEELLLKMDRCGVDRAVILPSRPKAYALQPANSLVGKLVRWYTDRLYGFVRVDPWQGPEAVRELRRGREELGLHGLLLHPWEEQFQVSSRLVDPLMDYAALQGMPVMVEAGYPLVSHPLDIAELAHRYPQVPIIATHGLQLDSSAFALMDAEVAMRECANLYMETSGMYAPETMENLARDLGAHRLVYGSHSPWLNFELELQRVKLLNLTPDELAAVQGRNMQTLLGGTFA